MCEFGSETHLASRDSDENFYSEVLSSSDCLGQVTITGNQDCGVETGPAREPDHVESDEGVDALLLAVRVEGPVFVELIHQRRTVYAQPVSGVSQGLLHRSFQPRGMLSDMAKSQLQTRGPRDCIEELSLDNLGSVDPHLIGATTGRPGPLRLQKANINEPGV